MLLLPVLWAADAALVADAYISAATPATNYGAAVSLNIATGNAALVRFDLSALPGGTSLSVAYLRIYVNKVTTAGTLTFSQITSNWSEGAVTSGTAPSTAASFATMPGNTANAFLLVDVTTLVNGWLASPATNFGIQIDGTGATAVALDSKETIATSHPATLEISVIAPSGPVGPTGAQGNTGAQGPAGATGTTGGAGGPGATGPSGATGPKGPAGAAGTTGATGPLGPTGASGATGAAGAMGAAGAQGVTGATGATGATGPQGNLGATGAPGAGGPTGPTGPAGANGPAGVAGAQGAQGTTGPTGPTGGVGPAGATGAQGAQGAIGIQGSVGPVGATGIQGANGPTSSTFNLDPTIRSHGYVIPNTDPYIYYLVNNTSNGANPANITLPLANVAGKMIVPMCQFYTALNAVGGADPNGSNNGINLLRQGTDTIISGDGAFPGLLTSYSIKRSIRLMSDGLGHWIVQF